MGTAHVRVTGIGVVAPNGVGKASFWETLSLGISRSGPVTLFDASRLQARSAGEARDFDPGKNLRKPGKVKRLARHSQFALVAGMQALDDAGLDPGRQGSSPSRCPWSWGGGQPPIAFDVIWRSMESLQCVAGENATPFAVTEAPPQAPAAAVAACLGVPTRVPTLSCACPAGLDAITRATELIRAKRADVAIAGGVDAPISCVPFPTWRPSAWRAVDIMPRTRPVGRLAANARPASSQRGWAW